MKSIQETITIKYLLVLAACVMIIAAMPLPAAAATAGRDKELNIVYLHGRGSTGADFQLLDDTLQEKAKTYISGYVQANPGSTVTINTLQRSYPNDVDVATWAQNIADSITTHFAGKKDLILITHSLGGKAALYGVAHNTGGLGDLTRMVVTINSPIRDLNSFYLAGGGEVIDYIDYIHGVRVTIDKGAFASVASYDSTADGRQVAAAKHWLAFISAEPAPTSPEYDIIGVDPFPRDMDDGAIPITAQYGEGADTVYYGDHGHGDFVNQPDAAGNIADQILGYLFGGTVQAALPTYNRTFEHQAGWLPLTNHWDDRSGESAGPNGVISHYNASFFKWEEWEDVVGGTDAGNLPGSYKVRLTSFPVLTSLENSGWLNPADPADGRLLIKTRAAPKRKVEVKWTIFEYPPLPPGSERHHYEIHMTGGTTQTGIPQADWLTGNPADSRLELRSQANGPFRWFKAEVRTFQRQAVRRKVIEEIGSK